MITAAANKQAVATPSDAILPEKLMQPEGKTANYLKCRVCSMRFIGYYTPMEMGKLARIMKHAHCPMCGADATKLTLSFI